MAHPHGCFKASQLSYLGLITLLILYISSNMKYAYLLTLLALSRFCLAQHNLSMPLSEYECILHYQQLSDGRLAFQNCQSTNPTPSNYFLFDSWKHCINLCCGLPSQDYPVFDQQSLRECRKSSDSIGRNNDIIRIVLIVLSMILAGGVVAAAIYKIVQRTRDKTFGHQCMADPLQNQTIDPAHPIWVQQVLNDSYATLQTSGSDELNECPICMEQGPNMTTTCSHRFHMQCLMKWFAKSKSCPLCKRSQTEQLKLKCKHCENRHVVVTVGRVLRNLEQWMQFNTVCNVCSKSQKIRSRSTTRDQALAKFRPSQVFDDNQAGQQ